MLLFIQVNALVPLGHVLQVDGQQLKDTAAWAGAAATTATPRPAARVTLARLRNVRRLLLGCVFAMWVLLILITSFDLVAERGLMPSRQGAKTKPPGWRFRGVHGRDVSSPHGRLR